MQTAFYLLKDHPDFKNIQFVLVPHRREHLDAISDIPQSFSKTLELAEMLFKKVDAVTHFESF